MVGFKNRYLVMEVFLDPNKEFYVDEPVIITKANLEVSIKDSILRNFGECGLASLMNSFPVKYVNPITKLFTLRTSREDYRKIWAAITMVKSVGNCPVVFNLLDLSGESPSIEKYHKGRYFRFQFWGICIAEVRTISLERNRKVSNYTGNRRRHKFIHQLRQELDFLQTEKHLLNQTAQNVPVKTVDLSNQRAPWSSY